VGGASTIGWFGLLPDAVIRERLEHHLGTSTVWRLRSQWIDGLLQQNLATLPTINKPATGSAFRTHLRLTFATPGPVFSGPIVDVANLPVLEHGALLLPRMCFFLAVQEVRQLRGRLAWSMANLRSFFDRFSTVFSSGLEAATSVGAKAVTGP